jgi:hypothetical protein
MLQKDLRGVFGIAPQTPPCGAASKKKEFVEYLFRCFHNSTFFSRTECVKLKPFSLKKHGAEQSQTPY